MIITEIKKQLESLLIGNITTIPIIFRGGNTVEKVFIRASIEGVNDVAETFGATNRINKVEGFFNCTIYSKDITVNTYYYSDLIYNLFKGKKFYTNFVDTEILKVNIRSYGQDSFGYEGVQVLIEFRSYSK